MEYTIGQLLKLEQVLSHYAERRTPDRLFAVNVRRLRNQVREAVAEHREELVALTREYGQERPDGLIVVPFNHPEFAEYRRQEAVLLAACVELELAPVLKLSAFPEISGNDIDVLEPVLVFDEEAGG